LERAYDGLLGSARKVFVSRASPTKTVPGLHLNQEYFTEL